MSNYVQEIKSEIEKDLAAFSDPGEPVVLTATPTGMLARWIQSSEQREALLVRSGDAFPRVEIDGKQFRYGSFLASSYMADLRRVAQTISRLGLGVKDYVETLAIRALDETDAKNSPSSATQLIADLASTSLPWGSTRVVFVKGPAGCGKTFILRKLAQDQAEDYLHGRANQLFFYVDAQGQALARLRMGRGAQVETCATKRKARV